MQAVGVTTIACKRIGRFRNQPPGELHTLRSTWLHMSKHNHKWAFTKRAVPDGNARYRTVPRVKALIELVYSNDSIHTACTRVPDDTARQNAERCGAWTRGV